MVFHRMLVSKLRFVARINSLFFMGDNQLRMEPDRVKVRLLFFAKARELMEREEEEVYLPTISTCRELKDLIFNVVRFLRNLRRRETCNFIVCLARSSCFPDVKSISNDEICAKHGKPIK